MKVQSFNPATEQVNKEFDTFSTEQVNEACRNAVTAFGEWRKLDASERAKYMGRLSSVLKAKSREYGRLMTLDMGKPIKQAISEVEKCAWAAEVYAANWQKWLADEMVEAGAKKSFITLQPIGVVLSIMPWNFPFWQAMRFGIPALTMGNVSVLRHSNVCPMSAMAIEESFRLAGFPEGTFRTIITDHDEVKRLIRSNLISGVSLTGSVEAGRTVGALAGKNIKKFVLELGGSDPFVVLEDADVKMASQKAAEGRVVNSGQSCIAAKRFIVVKSVAEEFTAGLSEAMSRLKVGNPLDMDTDVGPMASRQQVEVLDAQVKRAVTSGAKVVIGGKRMGGKGFFYAPTVLSSVRANMAIAREEVFGPVAPVIVAKDEKDAVRIANNSRFGLGGSVWTSDSMKGERIARELEVGLAYVNGVVASDPRFPFGGIKQSGIGRELSRYGLLEFANIKAIIMK